MGCAGTDLYRTNGPAYTGNGTYGAYLYNDEVVSIVRSHNLSVPLFLYVATQDAHGPDQVPSTYSNLFDPTKFVSAYAVYNGMGAAADDLFGNLTAELRARNM